MKNVFSSQKDSSQTHQLISTRSALQSGASLVASATPETQSEFLEGLSRPKSLRALPYMFDFWALPHQLPPEGDWKTWVILGGRGAGKTRAGARSGCSAQVEGFQADGRGAVFPRCPGGRDLSIRRVTSWCSAKAGSWPVRRPTGARSGRLASASWSGGTARRRRYIRPMITKVCAARSSTRHGWTRSDVPPSTRVRTSRTSSSTRNHQSLRCRSFRTGRGMI